MKLNNMKKRSLIVLALAIIATTFNFTTSFAMSSVTKLNELNNNKTISEKLNHQSVIVLHSTYWSLATVDKNFIQIINGPTTIAVQPGPNAPLGCQVAGTGCGTVTTKIKFIKKGVAQIAFQRSSCGEAMRCSPGQSSYTVKFKIK